MILLSFYLLKVITCSAVLFGYYWFFLRNKIFHSYNRFYLLAIVLLSLAFPMIKINVWHKANEPQPQVIKILQVVNGSDEYMDEVILYSHYNNISKEQVLSILYFITCLFFFILLIQALVKIWRMLKENPATVIENIRFVKTNAKGTPFSFFRFIFWNDAIDINSKAGRQVFKHEVAHVQEKHSYDKLFINVILIFCWCNPFFWIIRKELNMIHEFIADKKAVEDGDTTDFASMILQATYPQYRFPIANNFFYSPIKRRLTMLTKQNQAKVNYISRLLVLPVAIMVFAAFTLKTKTYTSSGSGVPGKTLTVMIDAGHGGTDNGATAAGNIYEKDISLVLAKKIKELNQSTNIKIILTRETDIYQSPQQKAILAKDAGADLFISIHADGAPVSAKNMITGMSVYVSKDQYENSKASKLLASAVITIFQKNYGLEVTANPQQREHGIWILQANACPSIIIEAGCINNPKNLAYLRTDKAVETFAGNILRAIENYLANEASLKNNHDPVSAPISISVDVKNTDSTYLKSNEYRNRALIIENSNEIGNLGNSYVEKNIARYNSIEIYNPVKARKIYGEKGRFGVIKLTLKEKKGNNEINGIIDHDLYLTDFQNSDSLKNAVPWTWDENAFAAATRPLFILDGKEVASIKEFHISNENIKDIRLLTPETSMPTYGNKAKHGVIIINTNANAVPANALIVLDDKIYEDQAWDQVMASNDFRAIERMEYLEKEKAIEKYGIKGTNGAIIATTRPGFVPNPTYTLSGIPGPRIHLSQLKNIRDVQLSLSDYSFKYATVYFSGAGFTDVVKTQITSGSLQKLEQYFSRVVAGTNVTFDNVKIGKTGTNSIMEISGKSFSFYDKEKDNLQAENIFTKVETEPGFPNGKGGWLEYLQKNLDAGMPVKEGWKPGKYTIVVQFIVDKDGYISEVKTDDFPGSRTAKQCIDLIRNGPRWIPAKQNGNVVKAYKKQPISFVVSEQ